MSETASAPSKSPRQSEVNVHQLMLPHHANAWGKVHGGMIMKLVDEAGGICAMRHAARPCVTVAIDSMTFRSGIEVGEVVCCEAVINYVGRTAIEVTVRVLAENPIKGVVSHTNTAHLVYVAIDDDGAPCQVPGLELATEEDRQAWEAGKLRQLARKARRPAATTETKP